MQNHEFIMGNYYMFIFPYGVLNRPDVIVEMPTLIYEKELLFHFLYNYKSEGEFVKKEDILAVGDKDNGTVEIKGWGGKYTILNQELFDKYVVDGIIQLK